MLQITVLQPETAVPLDRFGQWLSATGADLRIVLLEAEAVPRLDDLGDGLLVLGGRMDAHADLPWVRPLKRLLVEATDAGLPTLGICLGHQLLADALGGTVVVSDPGGGEEGVVVLDWTDAAASDSLFGAVVRVGRRQPSSHHDVVSVLPEGAVELARTDRYPNQAFRVGNSVGVQFHPEASPELVESWVSSYGHDADAVRRALAEVDDEVAAVGRAIVEGFIRTLAKG